MVLTALLRFLRSSPCMKPLDRSFRSCAFHHSMKNTDKAVVFFRLEIPKNRIFLYSSGNDDQNARPRDNFCCSALSDAVRFLFVRMRTNHRSTSSACKIDIEKLGRA